MMKNGRKMTEKRAQKTCQKGAYEKFFFNDLGANDSCYDINKPNM